MEKLNARQREAVEFPFHRPLKVVAGAGTGKTQVLTLRYAEALKRMSTSPGRILALTFSNKAASEMKGRILKRVCLEGLAGEEDFTEAFIGTFHSFASKLLRDNAIAAGLDPGFTVVEEMDARLIWLGVVEDYLKPGGSGRPESLPYEKRNFFETAVYGFILGLKDSAISPDSFLEASLKGAGEFAAHVARVSPEMKPAKMKTLPGQAASEAGYERGMAKAIFHLYGAYQRALRERALLDFGDLLLEAVNLLDTRESLRARLEDRYLVILVDEFQDTNRAQFKMLSLVARPGMGNVTVVGDEKQAIYGWRNARVENVDDFRAVDWGGDVVELDTNYRSFGQILDAAHSSIVHSPRFSDRSRERLVPYRKRSPANPIKLLVAPDVKTEAQCLAGDIAGSNSDGVAFGDMAILMRSVKASARPFEDALRLRGIPYQTVGGTGFYDRQEVKDVLAFLRVAHNPYDNRALARVMMRPPFSMTDNEVYQIASAEAAKAPDDGRVLYLFDALEESRTPEALRLAGFLKGLIINRSRMPLRDLTLYALEASGYLDHLGNLPVGEGRRSMANILKIIEKAGAFDGSGSLRGLGDFVDYLLYTLEEGFEEAEASPLELDSVSIITVHQAKGLEFPFVYLVDARKGRFPSRPRYSSLDFLPESGLFIKTGLLGDNPLKYSGDGIPGWPGRKEMASNDRREEERRLWYVAMTRAMDRLWISASGEPGEFMAELLDGVKEGSVEADIQEEPDLDRLEREEVCSTAVSTPVVAAHGPWPASRERSVPDQIHRVSLTFSAMRTYMSCPRRYLALHRWGLGILQEEASRPGGPGMGRLIHQVIRLYHLGGKPADLQGILEEAASIENMNLEEFKERAMECMAGYLSSGLASGDPHPDDLERPFRWRIEMERAIVDFSGVVDRVERRPGETWLVDYKTGKTGDEDRDLYFHQMRLYRRALAQVEPELVRSRMFLLTLPEGSLREVPEGDDMTMALLEEIALKIVLNHQEGTTPGEMGACPYCEIALYCLGKP